MKPKKKNVAAHRWMPQDKTGQLCVTEDLKRLTWNNTQFHQNRDDNRVVLTGKTNDKN